MKPVRLFAWQQIFGHGQVRLALSLLVFWLLCPRVSQANPPTETVYTATYRSTPAGAECVGNAVWKWAGAVNTRPGQGDWLDWPNIAARDFQWANQAPVSWRSSPAGEAYQLRLADNRLQFRWSTPAQKQLDGESFTWQGPAAPLAYLDLQVPVNRTVLAPGATVFDRPESPAATGYKTSRIYLDNRTSQRIHIVSPLSAGGGAFRYASHTRYELLRDKVRIRTAVAFLAGTLPVRNVQVELPAGYRLIALGENAEKPYTGKMVAGDALPGKENKSTYVYELSKNGDIEYFHWEGPLPVEGQAWNLPELRLPQGVLLAETLQLLPAGEWSVGSVLPGSFQALPVADPADGWLWESRAIRTPGTYKRPGLIRLPRTRQLPVLQESTWQWQDDRQTLTERFTWQPRDVGLTEWSILLPNGWEVENLQLDSPEPLVEYARRGNELFFESQQPVRDAWSCQLTLRKREGWPLQQPAPVLTLATPRWSGGGIQRSGQLAFRLPVGRRLDLHDKNAGPPLVVSQQSPSVLRWQGAPPASTHWQQLIDAETLPLPREWQPKQSQLPDWFLPDRGMLTVKRVGPTTRLTFKMGVSGQDSTRGVRLPWVPQTAQTYEVAYILWDGYPLSHHGLSTMAKDWLEIELPRRKDHATLEVELVRKPQPEEAWSKPAEIQVPWDWPCQVIDFSSRDYSPMGDWQELRAGLFRTQSLPGRAIRLSANVHWPVWPQWLLVPVPLLFVLVALARWRRSGQPIPQQAVALLVAPGLVWVCPGQAGLASATSKHWNLRDATGGSITPARIVLLAEPAGEFLKVDWQVELPEEVNPGATCTLPLGRGRLRNSTYAGQQAYPQVTVEKPGYAQFQERWQAGEPLVCQYEYPVADVRSALGYLQTTLQLPRHPQTTLAMIHPLRPGGWKPNQGQADFRYCMTPLGWFCACNAGGVASLNVQWGEPKATPLVSREYHSWTIHPMQSFVTTYWELTPETSAGVATVELRIPQELRPCEAEWLNGPMQGQGEEKPIHWEWLRTEDGTRHLRLQWAKPIRTTAVLKLVCIPAGARQPMLQRILMRFPRLVGIQPQESLGSWQVSGWRASVVDGNWQLLKNPAVPGSARWDEFRKKEDARWQEWFVTYRKLAGVAGKPMPTTFAESPVYRLPVQGTPQLRLDLAELPPDR